MAGLQIWSAAKETQVWDEAFELGSGYSYLKTGKLRFNLEQPPLAKVLAALPLLYLNPSLPTEDPSWINKDDVGFGIPVPVSQSRSRRLDVDGGAKQYRSADGRAGSSDGGVDPSQIRYRSGSLGGGAAGFRSEHPGARPLCND